jgi:hypothetical protein
MNALHRWAITMHASEEEEEDDVHGEGMNSSFG